MIKYVNTQVVFREFPDEVTLAINLSLCPNKCKGCHSSYLQQDIGEELTEGKLDELIKQHDSITCVGLMGGDNDVRRLGELFYFIKQTYPSLKIGWYSGKDKLEEYIQTSKICDYIKYGSYKEEMGGLDKETTNQRMLKLIDNNYTDITDFFYKK